MTATIRRLTDSERAAYTRTIKATVRCEELVYSGAVQCDRCDRPAQTAAFAAHEVDCVCFDCFPTYNAELVARVRAGIAAGV